MWEVSVPGVAPGTHPVLIRGAVFTHRCDQEEVRLGCSKVHFVLVDEADFQSLMLAVVANV